MTDGVRTVFFCFFPKGRVSWRADYLNHAGCFLCGRWIQDVFHAASYDAYMTAFVFLSQRRRLAAQPYVRTHCDDGLLADLTTSVGVGLGGVVRVGGRGGCACGHPEPSRRCNSSTGCTRWASPIQSLCRNRPS